MANLTTLSKEEADKMGVKGKLNDFKETFEEAEVRVADWAAEEGAKIKEAYHHAEDSVNEAVKSFTTLVKKNPVSSVAAGFGLGCLAGIALSMLSKRAEK